VQFTASAEFYHKLEKLRALMGSKVPDGDLAAVIEQAVTEKLERLEARRFARTRAPRKLSGHPHRHKGPVETDETEARLSRMHPQVLSTLAAVSGPNGRDPVP
jgi:hypothetical protein